MPRSDIPVSRAVVSSVCIAALALTAACGDSPGSPNGVEGAPSQGPPGRLVVIGGALQVENEAVYQSILDGRNGDGPLCVIPVASGVAEEAMASAVAAIDEWGGEGTALGVFISVENPEAAADLEVASTLASCSGYYFTGGSQSRVVDVFKPEGEPTRAYDVVLRRYREGAVVSGSSAGAAMMSSPMIAGGSSLEALNSGVRLTEEGEGVWVREGMGFTDAFITDQHFLARGRWGRLLTVISSSAGLPVGIGVDENTAFVFEEGEGWVVGESGAIIFDARDPAVGVRALLLGVGDRYRLSDGGVAADAGKMALPIVDASLTVPEDPFEPWAFLALLGRFGNTGVDEVVLETEAGTITLTKSDGFRAVSFSETGPQGTPRGLSVGPFVVTRD